MSSLFESRFRAKISSFFSPTDEEAAEIRSSLRKPRQRATELTQEIDRLEATLARLRDERACLQADILLHESLIAPIRSLPDSLLQDIFLACLPVTHNTTIHPNHAPLLFGRVNRHWRALSHSMPLLWRSAHLPGILDYDKVNDEAGQHDIDPSSRVASGLFDTFSRWIGFSSNVPLALSYTERPSFHTRDPASSVESSDAAFGATVTEHSHRIERLAVWGTREMVQCILTRQPAMFPKLRDLCCITANRFLDNAEGAFDFADATIFQSEALASLNLVINCPDPLTSLNCRWATLTQLGLICVQIRGQPVGVGLDQNGVRTILGRCPNLVRCELGITVGARLSLDTVPMVLPKLEQLFICTGFGANSEGLLDVIPFFRDLEAQNLWLFSLGQSNLIQILPTNTARRQPGRTDELVVYITPSLVDIPLMLDTLRALPRTTSLFLCATDGTPASFTNSWLLDLSSADSERLFRTLIAEDLCPVLESLTMNLYSSASALESSGMLEFIRARPASLRMLKLYFVYGCTDEDDERLRELTKEGIELEVNQKEAVGLRKWKYDPFRGL
ncbi:F-box domain-containing protein [Mycena kentingensis (nom. inval.)]|nr:F-box domain-containing protein [Mycena kentingensis (nom. inval.)]